MNLITVPAFCEEKAKAPSSEEKKKSVFDMEKYKYGGYKYRSPFVYAETAPGDDEIDLNMEYAQISVSDISPESLKVTGIFVDESDMYAILSSKSDFYIAKGGRLYSENNVEVAGVAAIVKDKKIMLITNENQMYELSVPE